IQSRYDFPSFLACSLSTNALAASPLNFGYGGPDRQVSKPLLRSTNQVPVMSNGAFGRGALRFAGASAPSCPAGTAADSGAAAVGAAALSLGGEDVPGPSLY